MSRAATRFNNELRYRGGDHQMQRQLTPGYVLAPVVESLGGDIGLDPCTEPDNPTGAERFYTVEDDGLTLPWDAGSIFVNPPYSKAREPWVDRCIAAGAAGAMVALLIPAATDTRVFQRAIASASSLVLIKGRVKFGVLRSNRRQEAASHPSALIGWNVDLATCSGLGTVVDLSAAARLRSLAAIYEQPLNRDQSFTFTGRELAAMLKEEG